MGFGTTLASGASVGFSFLFARTAEGAGFGPLVQDPDGILDLPAGFKYQLLQSKDDVMSDGAVVRGSLDGMAAFAGSTASEVILMRNHELAVDGGVSRLVLDTTDPGALVVVSSNDVLGSTLRNCSGGPSPWGWLSCEERPGMGGVWLCPIDIESRMLPAERVRIDCYGTFSHEAVAIDPDTYIAYLTEDDGDSFLYRFVPTDASVDPFSGQLQAMKRVGGDNFSTAGMNPGQVIDVEWVDVSAATPRADAQAAAATIVVRGEGIWWFDGIVYFCATSNGQVFELVPNADNSGGTLRLLADTLAGPDNVTVAPWGELFVAEDNGVQNRIRVVDSEGVVSTFALNRVTPVSELAGVCFSPDGTILFLNIYSGKTLAITGPFPGVEQPNGSGGSGGNGGADPGSAGDDAGGSSDGGEGGRAAGGDSGNGGASTTSG
ncbi:MAG TPA: alkaline phosphatase PhoX, partial [Polyangiaceae bacterium]|nr:alkaline phosphatase PhoX [Polyangiaceae bacterium]